jgi:hypothetical protein
VHERKQRRPRPGPRTRRRISRRQLSRREGSALVRAERLADADPADGRGWLDYLGSLRHYTETPVHGLRCGRQAEIMFAADLRRRAQGRLTFADEWALVDARMAESESTHVDAPIVRDWRSAIRFLKEEQRERVHSFADMPSVLSMSRCPCDRCSTADYTATWLYLALGASVDLANPIIALVQLFL